MIHNHRKTKILQKENIRVAECFCGARKVLIDGIPTSWIEGYYKKNKE